MLSAKTFYWRWIKTAVWRAPDPIDLWTGVATALLGFADHGLPWLQLMTTYAWQILLWVGVAILIARLILAPYLMAKEDIAKIRTATTITVSNPILFRDHVTNHWRVRIRNVGSVTANNVQMRLQDIIPRPRYASWKADYPYLVLSTTTPGQYQHKINPNDREDFEFIVGWPSGEGRMFSSGLDTKDSRNYVCIEPDERWKLIYAITAENAAPVHFCVAISLIDEAWNAERID